MQILKHSGKIRSDLTAKKARYTSMINEYRLRKEKLKLEESTPKIQERIANMNKKLQTWRTSMSRLKKVTEGIRELYFAVNDFTGISFTHKNNSNHHTIPVDVKIAKCLYYKYGLEAGFSGKDLREFIGVYDTQSKQARYYRKKFTVSFETIPYNKILWDNFKKFYYDVQLKDKPLQRRRRKSVKDIEYKDGSLVRPTYAIWTAQTKIK